MKKTIACLAGMCIASTVFAAKGKGTLPDFSDSSTERGMAYIKSFSLSKDSSGYCTYAIKVYCAAGSGCSCCSSKTSSSSKKTKIYYKVWFDWDRDGSVSSSDLQDTGSAVFSSMETGSFSKKVKIPSSAKGWTVYARAIIGVGKAPSDVKKLEGLGDYADGSFFTGCVAPVFHGANIGAYASSDGLSDAEENVAIAGKTCRAYPIFKMTPETMSYINGNGGMTVKCGKDSIRRLTEFKEKAIKDVGNGYSLYATKNAFEFTVPMSTEPGKYGRQNLEFTVSGSVVGSSKNEQAPYYVFFDINATSGGKPLWFKVWQDVISGMKNFSYDSSVKSVSDLEYAVGAGVKGFYETAEWNEREKLLKIGDAGTTISIPVQITHCVLGKGVMNSSAWESFNIHKLYLQAPEYAMWAAYAGCSIELAKKDLLKRLKEKLDVNQQGIRRFVRANDDDNDFVDDSIEKDIGLLTTTKDSFGVGETYDGLKDNGDLEYASRWGASPNDFAKKYGKKDWSYPNGYQSGYLDALISMKTARKAVKAMTASSAVECHSRALDEQEILEEMASSSTEEEAVAAVTGVKETTFDFEGNGLEFVLDATLPGSGEYEFSAYLTDIAGIPFARAKTTGAFESGENKIPLRFSSETMAQTMPVHPGPWKISVVTVRRHFVGEASVESRIEITPCESADYSGRTPNVSEFVLAGLCSDELRDGNVAVSIPVNVPVEGDYEFQAVLAHVGDGTTFATSVLSNRFARGKADLTFAFTPEMLSVIKQDGPYLVRELAVIPLDGGDGSVLSVDHVTQPYSFEELVPLTSRLSLADSSYMELWRESASWSGPCVGIGFQIGVKCKETAFEHKVRCEVDLVDADGMAVASASQVGVIDRGVLVGIISGYVPAKDVVESGCFGAYSIGRVRLYDADTDELLDEYRPIGVLSEEFEEADLDPGEAPWVNEDAAVVEVPTVGGAMRHPEIRISVPVGSSYSGKLSGRAELYGAGGAFIAEARARVESGSQDLVIRFDGAEIRESGVDGPYEIRNLTVHDDAVPDLPFMSERTFVTGAYSYADFVPQVFGLSPFPSGIGTFSAVRKLAYDCVLLTAQGELAGTVRISTGVANKSGAASVSARITRFGKKAVTLSGKALEDGRATLSAKSIADKCVLTLGGEGVEGQWGDLFVLGSRDAYSMGKGAEAEELARTVKGSWTVVAGVGTHLQIVVDAKGNAKVSGRDGEGHVFSATARVIRGDGFVYVPVYVAKTKKTDAAHIWIRISGEDGGMSFLDGSGLALDDSPYGAKTREPTINDWSGGEVWTAMIGAKFSSKDLCAGDELAYPYKFAAKNLPKGMKINAATGEISGVPTKSGTNTVTVTLTSGYNKTWGDSVQVKIAVGTVPKEFVGTFIGTIPGMGTASLTVAKTGKVSGKLNIGGKAWTFASSAFAQASLDEEGWRTTVSAKATCGKRIGWFNWILRQADFHSDASLGVDLLEYAPEETWFRPTFAPSDEWNDWAVDLYRNVWKDKGATTALATWAGAYTAVVSGGDKLTLSLDMKGTVKFSGKLSDGRKVSASSTLVVRDGTCLVCLYLPADAKRKYGEVAELFTLKNFPGEPIPGSVAYRNAGVWFAKTSGGSASMSPKYGQVAAGGKVKLTAKANKKQAFAGWYDVVTGELISQATSYALVSDGVTDRFVEARFAKESDLSASDFTLDWDGLTNLTVGVAYSAKLTVSGAAAVKIASVSGLPKGLNWKSGKVSGVPTTAKTNTVSVKVALVTNTKKTWTLKQTLVVEPLPEWAAQTFEGNLGTEDEPVPVTVTIGSSGKVSGKYTLDGAKWTFSSSSLSSAVCDEATGEPSVFTANVTASATISKKKKSQKLVVTVMEAGVGIQVP